MKLSVLALAAAAVAFAVPGLADTRSSDQDRATQEHKASPSNPVHQEEETTQAHSAPDSHPPASSSAGASKDKPAKKSHGKKSEKKSKTDKSSSSAGASRPQAALASEKEQAFQALDLDGDGKVQLAEAAGNAGVVMGFDRADRNRDGALTRAEFNRLGKKPKAKHQAAR